MFNNEELDALASKAKEQLREQQQGEESEVDYADLMNDDSEDYGYSDSYEDDTEEEYQKGVDFYNNLNEQPPSLSPYDEPLFPGGPSKSQIEAWKKDWAGYNIYITEIIDRTFIFRTLNRFEYKQLVSMQNVDALQREEIICQTVTLYPDAYTWEEMASSLAGIPSTYAEIIMEKSGFTKDIAIQVI